MSWGYAALVALNMVCGLSSVKYSWESPDMQEAVVWAIIGGGNFGIGGLLLMDMIGGR